MRAPNLLLSLLRGRGGGDLSLATLGTGLLAAGISLGLQVLDTALLGLGLEDVLHQHTLVLELVTLDLQVQRVVQVLVDLLLLAVLAEQTTQNAHAANPHHLGGETGLTGTLALTSASVATLALLGQTLVGAETRVDSVRLADDEAVLHQLADVLACWFGAIPINMTNENNIESRMAKFNSKMNLIAAEKN